MSMLIPPSADQLLQKSLEQEKAVVADTVDYLEGEQKHKQIMLNRVQFLQKQIERRREEQSVEQQASEITKVQLDNLSKLILDRQTTLRSEGYQSYLFENSDVYEGEWKNSKMHGRGVMKYSQVPHLYEGEWFLGSKNGTGTFHDARSKVTYSGKWSDGKKHGKGEQVEPEGVYKGEFRDGKIHGSGEYHYLDASHTYKGDWVNEMYHGIGTYTISLGTQSSSGKSALQTSTMKYDGEWKMGKPHGRGSFVHSDGDTFVGEWVGGKRHGYGTYTSHASGYIYEGMWKYDAMHGYGTCRYSDGSVYEGEWEKDLHHGKGKLTVVGGLNNKDEVTVYEGTFKRGKRDGKGAYTVGMVSASEVILSAPIQVNEATGAKVSFPRPPPGGGLAASASSPRQLPSSSFTLDTPPHNRRGNKPTAAAGARDPTTSSKRNPTAPEASEVIPVIPRAYVGDWKDDKKQGSGVFLLPGNGVYQGSWDDDVQHGEGYYKLSSTMTTFASKSSMAGAAASNSPTYNRNQPSPANVVAAMMGASNSTGTTDRDDTQATTSLSSSRSVPPKLFEDHISRDSRVVVFEHGRCRVSLPSEPYKMLSTQLKGYAPPSTTGESVKREFDVLDVSSNAAESYFSSCL